MSKCVTKTEILFKPHKSKTFDFDFYFDGKPMTDFEIKLGTFFKLVSNFPLWGKFNKDFSKDQLKSFTKYFSYLLVFIVSQENNNKQSIKKLYFIFKFIFQCAYC